MSRNRRHFFERLSLGYSFDKDREILSMVYINYFIILIFSLVVILIHAINDDIIPVTYRYHAVVVIAFLQLWFLKKRLILLTRILILSVLPILLLILPPLAGLFDDEFYFWFPYVPIGLSLIPHFILHTTRHRAVLISVLAAYLILGLFIDSFMMYLDEGQRRIVPIVQDNRFYYKLIPALIFIYVNVALGLLFAKNHRYEEIMQMQQEDLIQAEKMASLGTLTAGIAHEINNPLNFISGSLNAMKTLKERYIQHDSANSEIRGEIIQQMDQVIENSFEGVSRATDIISKLSFFANPEQGIRKETNLAQLLQKTLSSIESKLPYYIHLESDVPQSQMIWCNEQQMRLVFSHILRNAIDAFESSHGRERELIRIESSEEARERNTFSRISFSNSGPAIPEEDMKHIFDPFFSSREVGKGVGLGMSLSYRIVKEHGGNIEATNQEGMVRFDVFLPIG